MAVNKNNALLPLARTLRRDMTPQERKLWYLFLKAYPVKVYRQRIIGSYIVDFYCAAAKLVIELDGSQHYEEAGKASDKQRDAFLINQGLMTLRFSNADINGRFHAVCEKIHLTIQSRL